MAGTATGARGGSRPLQEETRRESQTEGGDGEEEEGERTRKRRGGEEGRNWQ